MSVGKNSRYLLTESVTVIDPLTGEPDTPTFMDFRQRVSTFGDDDKLVQVDASKGWAHLGLGRLGDAKAWWVIADLSNVVDPFAELVPGNVVRVPSVSRYLFNIVAPQQSPT